MSNWSELQYDLLALVIKRLNLIEDFFNFGMVCKSWRFAASKDNFNSDLPRIPWLMLAEDKGSSCRQFYSLHNGMILNKTLPEARGKRCLESMGWLITVGKDEGEITLLHPFSRVQIELPHQNTTEDYEVYQTPFPWTFFHKAVLSASPSHTSDYVLMVIEADNCFLSFWRPGDLQWTRIRKHTPYCSICDVVFFNGQFYAVDWKGCVLVCDVAGTDPTQPPQLVAQLPSLSLKLGYNLYILQSLGSCFVVVRYGVLLRVPRDESDRIPLTRMQSPFMDDEKQNVDEGVNEDVEEDVEEDLYQTYGTTNFLVYELDVDAGRLTQTKELGDRAIFVGYNASVCVQASEYPGIKPNHIYFTDDCFEAYLYYAEGGGLDMGVFNLGDGTIHPLYKGLSLSRVCPPTWVTPTLY